MTLMEMIIIPPPVGWGIHGGNKMKNKKAGAEYDTFVKLKGLWYAKIFDVNHKIIDVSPGKKGKLALCGWVHDNYRGIYNVS